jgi:hypothetical protein
LTELIGGGAGNPLDQLPARYAEGRVTHAPMVFYNSDSKPAQKLFDRNGMRVRGWFDPAGDLQSAMLSARGLTGPDERAVQGEAAKLQLASPDTIGRGIIQVNMDPGFFTPEGNFTQLTDGRLVDGRAPAIRHEQVHYAVQPFIGALDQKQILDPTLLQEARESLSQLGYPADYIYDPRKLPTETLATYSQEQAPSDTQRAIFQALLEGIRQRSPQTAAQVERLATRAVQAPAR